MSVATRGKTRAAAAAAAAAVPNGTSNTLTPPSTSRRIAMSAKKAALAAQEGQETQQPPTKRRKTRITKIEEAVKADQVAESEFTPAKKAVPRRKKDSTLPPPDPPHTVLRHGDWAQESGTGQPFTGRLGYACLNALLRKQKPEPVFCSRTLRLATLKAEGIGKAFELAKKNVLDLIPLLRWNAQHGIEFMRLSSDIFPFASHKDFLYSVTDAAGQELAEVAQVRKTEWPHGRLTMHPGQFNQLGSPNKSVVEATVRELQMHADILDALGEGPDAVMIIHGGGTYGNRQGALERMAHSLEGLPAQIRDRLVFENDEMSWSAEELLPLCERFSIPLVFDFHHDLLRPSSIAPAALIPRIEAIWHRRGIRPKYHISEAKVDSGEGLRDRRAHSSRCLFLPTDLPPGADVMIEAKDKEQAVFDLARIYRLEQAHGTSDRAASTDEANDEKKSNPNHPLTGLTVPPPDLVSPEAVQKAMAIHADMVARAEEIREHLRTTGKRLKYERGAGEEAPQSAKKSQEEAAESDEPEKD